MKTEQIILDFIKSKNKKLEIFGLKGLVKTGENEWSFRFTYRKGDYLSISKLFKVKLEGLDKKPSLIIKKSNFKRSKNTIKQR